MFLSVATVVRKRYFWCLLKCLKEHELLSTVRKSEALVIAESFIVTQKDITSAVAREYANFLFAVAESVVVD